AISETPSQAPPKPQAAPAPAAPLEPLLDHPAVAAAEAQRAAAQRDLKRAQDRASEAARALNAASSESAGLALSARSLGSRLRDPTSRLSRAAERITKLAAQQGKIQSELVSLANAPKPKRKSLIDRTPVAKPAEGHEYHFEVRRNRVSFIDLETLLERVKSDALLRIRMNRDGQPISSSVGPIGGFSLQYELSRSLPGAVEDLLEMRGPTYNLRSWELVPEFEGRGETFETAFRPASDFARTINRLTPTRATITMWVYPDGFALYRKLRDALHARGFLVAARPLPEGMAIRGSPAGSLSAGQ
ncbi:MAG TPA: hypothetical protein VGY53_02955, partial [Isosphaeraceae bacterium]|nr:hypothetical protein [Isosphaeraceae bacterium]